MVAPSLSLIVLNYNSKVHLEANLPSLMALDYPADKLEIIVADNASTDDSMAWVTANYPTVQQVHTGGNLGFAGGNNVAAAAASSDWVVFLNPDMRVTPNWLVELTRPIQQDPTVACVASRILSWDGKTIDFGDAAMNFMGWGCQPGFGSHRLDEFDQEKPLLFACGGAMLIKRSLFLELGGFDDDYFAYFEDVDLGWRLGLMGQPVVFAPQAIVYHRHHGSWENVADAKKWVLSERNTLFSVIKNYEDWALTAVLPATLLLLAERAYLDVRPDHASLGLPEVNTTQETAVYNTRYYLSQLVTLLKQGNIRQLSRRIQDEIGRRFTSQPPAPSPQPLASQLPENGRFAVPAITLSRLVAANDVLRSWEQFQAKRADLQAQRQQPDKAIFPLFQWELVSNFGDEAFIQAMNFVNGRFALANLFDTQQPAPNLSPETIALSQTVSQQILRHLAAAFNQSNIPENLFRLGQPAPEPTLRIPAETVRAIAQLHNLLWTMPQMPLPELLQWMYREFERFAKET
ncbi:MAG: glycosyltransferase family 2 protein [Chloroflexota bacterium]